VAVGAFWCGGFAKANGTIRVYIHKCENKKENVKIFPDFSHNNFL